MKHIKHLFTALLLLCATIAFAEEVTIDGIKYDVVTKAKVATVISGGSYSGDIVIPESVEHNGVTYNITSIGSSAFRYCTGLTSIEIPNSVTSIGDHAFYWCSGLTSITIPNSVTSIGYRAFYNCSGLKTVFNFSNLTFSKDSSNNGDIAYYADKVINAPNGFIDGDFGWFENENGMTLAGYLGDATELTLPTEYNEKSVTGIGFSAFYNCYRLTSIEIPNSVTSIGSYAFYKCSGLTSIVIPNSVTSIGDCTFSGCSGLTSIVVDENNTKYDSRENCNAIIETETNTLVVGCKNTKIPNSVTSIGGSAFSGCTGLTSVTIGTGVKGIYTKAFAKCSNLTDVYCLATTVPSTNADAFNESYPEYMTLHVPAEAIDSYRTTAPWSSFGTIVTLGGETPEIPETPKCANPVISYTNGKLSLECATEDAEFITDVTCSDVKKFYDSEINFSATYNIAVYATAKGYDNSDIVNATLCWIECECEGDDTGIINIPAKAVLVTSSNGSINISCSLDGESVAVYTTAGTLIAKTTIENGAATVATGLSKGSVAIVKIADKSIKVAVN